MFNCRLDRRYPLTQFIAINNKEINSIVPLPKSSIPDLIVDSDTNTTGTGHPQIAPAESELVDDWQTNFNHKWITLNIKEIQFEDYEDNSAGFNNENGLELFSPSQGSLVSQMSRLDLETEAKQEKTRNFSEKVEVAVEHSQQLILGLTHSMKNMLLKLGPVPISNSIASTSNQSKQQQQQVTGLEGYSFAFKTSKYRIHYFESFTGWKLVMITDCLQSTAPSTSTTTTIKPETALKSFYSQVLLKFLVTYPLGTIFTSQKSTDNQRILVENDFLHRAGFLSKMDEFIQNIDELF